jgi:putative dehydrogenase
MSSGNKGVVGIIGLGIMGGAFAENLVAAGWRVIGYDIAPARRKALARAGVEIAADAVDVARQDRHHQSAQAGSACGDRGRDR